MTTTAPSVNLDDAAERRHRRNKKALLIVSILAVVVLAWTQGIFDNFLWHVGLNYNDCAQNGFGATFCGDALEHYKQNVLGG